MKAVVLTEAGGTENLVFRDLNRPQLKEQEVLVQVHALSINPVDVKTRKGGGLLARLQEQGPAILGWDISGVVVQKGSSVTKFNIGDAVFGMVNFPGAGQAYAEYVAAPEDHLTLKPANSSHAEAAATTLAALTAWQVLVHEANMQQGQHLLVHAAAGGVGHLAVQIAKQLGVTVTGTASAANEAFLRELGVDHFVDYTKTDFEKEAGLVDVVLDPVGGETTARSLQVLKKGGILISIVGGVKDHLQAVLEEKEVRGKNYLVHSSGKDMEELAHWIEDGRIRPHVAHQYSFDQIAAAHQQIETGRTRGKLVVQVV